MMVHATPEGAGTSPVTTTMRAGPLVLHAATLALLDAELEGPAALGASLRAAVPSDWPPGEYDHDAIRFFRATLAELGADGVGWLGWYGVTEAAPRTLVGGAGYFGPPDAHGVVEIGYSVSAEHRGRGYASTMVEALVARAEASGRVTLACAHTTPANVASVRVLEKAGFRCVGAGAEVGSIRFERRLGGVSA